MPDVLDSRAYRRTIGRFATGVSVLTAAHDGRRFAMTANSITSVSLEPPLVLACFMQDSDTGRAIRASGFFGLNVLDALRGEALARRFARKAEGDEDQLAGVDVHEGPHGLPLLEGCLEHLVCRVDCVHVVGDHDVVVAHAECVDLPPAGSEPLVWYAGGFWALRPL
ncbi:MAG: flavin reductase family protein [Thermoleophilia bacterium]